MVSTLLLRFLTIDYGSDDFFTRRREFDAPTTKRTSEKKMTHTGCIVGASLLNLLGELYAAF